MSSNVTTLAGFTAPAPVRLRARRRGAGFSDEFPSIPCLPWRRIGVLGGREAALPYPLGIFARGRADLVDSA